MKKIYIISLGIILVIFGVTFFLTSGTEASDSDKFYGWGESPFLGQVSFNCNSVQNESPTLCNNSNFGVTYDETTGNISGYAWSENAGWISFNESGCPSGVCQPKMDLTTGKLSGWARVLSLKNPSDTEINTATGASEEWADGWISLSGAGYGPTFNLTTGDGSGYAWGSNGIGWLSFGNIGILPTAPTLKLKANGNYESLTVNSGDSIVLSATGYELDSTQKGTASGDARWTGDKDCPTSISTPIVYPAFTLTNDTQNSVTETLALDCIKKSSGIIESVVTVNVISSQICSALHATNYGGSLPCIFDETLYCADLSASNYGEVKPCVYPDGICVDPNAKNYGKKLPCVYDNGKCLEEMAVNYGQNLPCIFGDGDLKCLEENAINYGGTLPCEFTGKYCDDSNAVNYGELIPCTYDCAKEDMTTYNASFPWCYCPTHPGDTSCASYCAESTGRCSKKPHYIEK